MEKHKIVPNVYLYFSFIWEENFSPKTTIMAAYLWRYF